MAKRTEADYDDFVFIDKKRLQPLFAETDEFVSIVTAMAIAAI